VPATEVAAYSIAFLGANRCKFRFRPSSDQPETPDRHVVAPRCGTHETALDHAELCYDTAMGAVHPYTIKVEVDPLNVLRFRWTVCEGTLVHMRGPHSYATRREAAEEASKVLSKLVENQPRRTDWKI
jgi:hypothetical protein